MACSTCDRDVPIENKDTGTCATCNKKARNDSGLYPTVKEEYLKKMISLDEVCPITGVPITMESDIHHTMGRVGYADAWAYENDISLLIDVRYFLAVSRVGHMYIEAAENREESEAKGWIVPRSQTYKR